MRIAYRTFLTATLFTLLLLLSACDRDEQLAVDAEVPAATHSAAETITAEDLLAHIDTLASDAFEGRAPGTPGETKTVAYLTEQFRRIGLAPGNPDGTYVQDVPLVGFTTRPAGSFSVNGRTISLTPGEDFVAVSRRMQPEVDVEGSELVFVGYGVVAPEYGWDDYKDVDVRGKTIVMLVNDPPVADPNDPSRLDTSMFKGQAMTYYGRWTYKYEIASEKGAAAAIIVHETGPAGYPFEVVSGSWGRENFDVQKPDGNSGRVAVEGWVTVDKARELFSAAGHDFETLKQAAARQDFRPVPLGGTATLRARNEVRQVRSQNVVALLEGSDPERRDEYVIYTAHWDHLGVDPSLADDQIFNGAVDNATGTAALIELAEAFAALPEPPARSVLFLAVTAEEKGLLGAKHYASSPLYPLAQTVAVVNMDALNPWGRTRDLVIVGYGNSTLDDLVRQEAAAQGRTVVPDPEPEKGYFYRSDHFEFAKQGVPALYVDAGNEFVDRPADYGRQTRDAYVTNDYHKPSDEVRPDWDLSGMVEDVRLFFGVGYRVAQAIDWPEWNPGTEFRAVREAMLGQRTEE